MVTEPADEAIALDILVWLNGNGICQFSKAYSASPYSSLDSTQDWVIAAAAGRGRLSILKWLQEFEVLTTDGSVLQAASYAATGGHLEVLKWLRTVNEMGGWGPLVCEKAASNGHIAILR